MIKTDFKMVMMANCHMVGVLLTMVYWIRGVYCECTYNDLKIKCDRRDIHHDDKSNSDVYDIIIDIEVNICREDKNAKVSVSSQKKSQSHVIYGAGAFDIFGSGQLKISMTTYFDDTTHVKLSFLPTHLTTEKEVFSRVFKDPSCNGALYWFNSGANLETFLIGLGAFLVFLLVVFCLYSKRNPTRKTNETKFVSVEEYEQPEALMREESV